MFNLDKTISRINNERGNKYRNVGKDDFLVEDLGHGIVKVSAFTTADIYDLIRMSDGYLSDVPKQKAAIFMVSKE